MVTNILVDRYRRGSLAQGSLLIGEPAIIMPLIRDFLDQVLAVTNWQISDQVYWGERKLLRVEEAREIRTRATRRVAEQTGRFFIIAAEQVTTEAQNALLKTIEEPNRGIYFLIIVSNEQVLLPTLISRLEKVVLTTTKSVIIDPIHFLTLSLPARVREVVKLRDQAERAESQTAIYNWLADLEVFFVGKLKHLPTDRRWQGALRELALVRRWFGRPGSGERLLLEHLALVLPKP